MERIEKFKAREVVENDWVERVENGDIRKCSMCGMYVFVEDFSSEYRGDKAMCYDVCQDCIDKHENGEDIVEEEEFYIEDILDMLDSEE